MADSVVTVVQGAASAAVEPAGGRNFASLILNPGSTASSVTVYDNTAASGKIICQLVAPANGYSSISPEVNIPTSIGIYVSLSGTGATFVIYYA